MFQLLDKAATLILPVWLFDGINLPWREEYAQSAGQPHRPFITYHVTTLVFLSTSKVIFLLEMLISLNLTHRTSKLGICLKILDETIVVSSWTWLSTRVFSCASVKKNHLPLVLQIPCTVKRLDKASRWWWCSLSVKAWQGVNAEWDLPPSAKSANEIFDHCYRYFNDEDKSGCPTNANQKKNVSEEREHCMPDRNCNRE